jgi:hypothetical protein
METTTVGATKKCGVCGGVGHNVRTCKHPDAEQHRAKLASKRSAADSASERSTESREDDTATVLSGISLGETSVGGVEPPTKARTKCGVCGCEGHNARTCSKKPTPSAPTDPEPVREALSVQATTTTTVTPTTAEDPIAMCTVTTTMTSTIASAEPMELRMVSTFPAPTEETGRKCGFCGQTGHNRRGCTVEREGEVQWAMKKMKEEQKCAKMDASVRTIALQHLESMKAMFMDAWVMAKTKNQ